MPLTATLAAVLANTSSLAAAEPLILPPVQVVENRLERPFDPDSTRILTAQRIAEYGASNLAEALDHAASVYIRTSGRGGVQADLRGGRKGGVLVLIDGVPISDPFFGTFNLASIPVTDISEIRVTAAPASPLDGAAGSSGVIEVITRAATGKPRLILRAIAEDAPSGQASATVKGDLSPWLGGRASGGIDVSGRDFQPIGGVIRGEGAYGGHGGLLLEHVAPGRRIGADFAISSGHYAVPPSSEDGSDALIVDHELSMRSSILGELSQGDARGSLRLFAASLRRDTLRVAGGDFSLPPGKDSVDAQRFGAIGRGEWILGSALTAQATLEFLEENGTDRDDSGLIAEGHTELLTAAAGARLHIFSWLQLDAAGGAALPLNGGADPWPEARLSLVASATVAELRLIGARKGRLPTLRERFQINTGNPAIAPEQTSHGEALLVFRPLAWLNFTLSGWIRNIEGLIRFPRGGTQLANVGDAFVRGIDARIDWRWMEVLEAGLAYNWATASSAVLGNDPLDFFPEHRGELWLSARAGRRFGGYARARYLSARQDNGHALAPYVTVDGGAWMQVDIVRMQLTIQNAFDQGYEARFGVPGFGRTLMLGAIVDTR
ncbi:MAG: TonB-dependent receptor [Myxococcota bacterium]